ncbi:hypothetical protein CSOJ01_11404 [Colletotrichum sojae]|uniref:Zygote-specific protein n=1 Tax=Colletotrichum sojae TaxID=2175907 RepID=A0A8H6IYJ6_9PEZI|nr:hypothetical protein CSOJ01_11404 [Colletotrichum sojae]
MNPTQALVTIALVTIPTATAGPVGYGICQAGCAAVVVACYAGAGATFGVTAGVATGPAVIACNAAFGQCQAA